LISRDKSPSYLFQFKDMLGKCLKIYITLYY
jgi:hypothetical protein